MKLIVAKNMSHLALVVFAFVCCLQFAACSEADLRHDGFEQCCGDSEILVEVNITGSRPSTSVVCVKDAVAFTSRLHQSRIFRHSRPPDEAGTAGLPKCGKSERLKYTELDSTAAAAGQTIERHHGSNDTSCAGYFHDPMAQRNFTAIVKCETWAAVTDDSETTAAVVVELAIKDAKNYDFGTREKSQPALDEEASSDALLYGRFSTERTRGALLQAEDLRLPRCCEEGKVYDVRSKACVDNGSSGFDIAAAAFVKNVESRVLQHFYQQQLACAGVLVDYSLSADDAHYDGRNLVLSLPWNEEKRNFTLVGSNGCVDMKNESWIIARVCLDAADYCKIGSCVSFCDQEGRLNKWAEWPSAKINSKRAQFQKLFSEALDNGSLTAEHFDQESYGLAFGYPCPMSFARDENESWHIGRGGVITLNASFGQEIPHDYSKACLTQLANGRIEPLFCFPPEAVSFSSPDGAIKSVIIGVAGLVSIFFLVLTFFTYAVLPSLQNLHGKTLMCHVFSLAMAFFSLSNINLNPIVSSPPFDEFSNALCRLLAYWMLFWFLSTFFWLNVMCFDIWWTFGGLQSGGSAATSVAMRKRRERRRFGFYCVYACGLPFLFTGLALMTEREKWLPLEMAGGRCWFEKSSIAEMIYFLTPVSVTLLSNVYFFFTTARRCNRVKNELKQVMSDAKSSKSQSFDSDRSRFVMNFRLFIVMGLPWTLENFTAYVTSITALPDWANIAMMVPDLTNALQGLWIFLLFICKAKIHRGLAKQFRIFRICQRSKKSRRVAEANNRGNATTTATSRRGGATLHEDSLSKSRSRSSSNCGSEVTVNTLLP